MQKPVHTEQSEDSDNKQAMLAAIIDFSEDAIISKTLDGIITSWNRSAERMFGYTEREAIGRHIAMLIPEENLPEEDMIINRITHGHRVPPFQTERMTKDGRRIPVSITVSPIRSKEGAIIGASKIARDISDELRAMQELEEYAKTQELLFSVSRTLSAQLDLQTTLEKVTDISTRLTGAEYGSFFYNRAGYEGKGNFSSESIVRSDDIREDPRYGQHAPYHGMPAGQAPIVSYLAVPVNSPAGQTIGGLFLGHTRPGMFREEHELLMESIASQAGVAIENARLYEAIQQLNNRKDEFIGVAGHELRTPIKGYLQLMEEYSPDPVSKSFIGKALRQVNKLNRLVTDLLDVSKIQAGRLQYNMMPCFLLPLVRESVDMVRQMHPSHRIETELPADDIIVTADGPKIEQVIINFLTNAIKYSPKADRVALRVTKEKDRVVVMVQDWGIGIPTEHLEHIFDRYYRVDATEHVIGGLGLGLYISHEVIRRHDGAVWVRSEPGEGAEFYFSLSLPE